jgi:hypothetical protein
MISKDLSFSFMLYSEELNLNLTEAAWVSLNEICFLLLLFFQHILVDIHRKNVCCTFHMGLVNNIPNTM